ncbi:hypothetical protein Tco_0262946, partial [Tanacetum coccineum]
MTSFIDQKYELLQDTCVAGSYRDDHVDLWVMKVYGVKDSWTILDSIPYLPDYG